MGFIPGTRKRTSQGPDARTASKRRRSRRASCSGRIGSWMPLILGLGKDEGLGGRGDVWGQTGKGQIGFRR